METYERTHFFLCGMAYTLLRDYYIKIGNPDQFIHNDEVIFLVELMPEGTLDDSYRLMNEELSKRLPQ